MTTQETATMTRMMLAISNSDDATQMHPHVVCYNNVNIEGIIYDFLTHSSFPSKKKV